MPSAFFMDFAAKIKPFSILAKKPNAMELVLLSLFYVFTPLIILILCHKFPLVNKLGAVIVAYGIGLLVGNIGIIPSMGTELNDYLISNPQATTADIETLLSKNIITYTDFTAYKLYKLRDLIMSITILLAIPLMLFSANIKQWTRLAGKTILSLAIGFFAVIFIVVTGYFIFKGFGINDLWKISGMLIGVYTGGTPNLASLKLMLDVDANTYILTHTYDLIIGVFYLAFLMTIGQKFFHNILPKFPLKIESVKTDLSRKKESFWAVFQPQKIVPLLKAYGVAILIFAIGGVLSMIVSENMVMVVVILSITTLGIVASLVPSINKIDKTFESGMYLILIFSIVVSSMADVRNFAGLTPELFAYITLAVFGSLLLQVLGAKLLKVDADTTMITSVAFICSPPFVPVIASAIGNRHVIVSGITIGIIGYAIGNYLGFIVAEVLRNFG